jgi:hypothetical protein
MMAVAANLASHRAGEMQSHPVLCFLNDSALGSRDDGMQAQCMS